MADICDLSDERIEMAIESGVEEARLAKPEAEEKGYCLTCGPSVPLPPGVRWCPGGECRDDWQIEQDKKKRLATLGV